MKPRFLGDGTPDFIFPGIPTTPGKRLSTNGTSGAILYFFPPLFPLPNLFSFTFFFGSDSFFCHRLLIFDFPYVKYNTIVVY